VRSVWLCSAGLSLIVFNAYNVHIDRATGLGEEGSMTLTNDNAPVAGMPLSDIRTDLAADGEPPEHARALLRAHLGAKADEAALVPLDVCWRIFSEHSARVGDETHRVFGRGMKPGGTTLLIARMLLSGNVLGAMRAYSEALAIMAPGVCVTVTSTRGGVLLRWRCEGPTGEAQHIALEATAMAYYAIFSWLAGEALPVLRVRAPAERKASGSTLLRLMRAPIAYAGEDLELVFAPQAASAAIALRPAESWYEGAYHMICSQMLCGGAGADGFAERARSAVLEGVDQQALADRWGVSIKTVARRLEQEGVSFRRIRDEVRMEKSASLIHAGLSVETIGDLLGYEDTRSFRRALHRWFGLSPSAYRTRPIAA
jgi:AraC-like DNA-binding protein